MLLSVCKKNLFEHLPIVPRFKRDLCGPKIEITMFEQNMDFCCIHTAINTGWELVRCLTDRLNKYLASLLQQCYLNIFSTFATHGLLQHLFVCLPGLYLNDSFLGQSPIAPNWSVLPKTDKKYYINNRKLKDSLHRCDIADLTI